MSGNKIQQIQKTKQQTPLMAQYFGMKAKYPDAIMLFRVGDFYETFGEDAIKASKILGIILTKRNNGSSHIELAGFPYHSLDNYLPKLVRSGHRVAICEQLEKPSKEKKLLKRGVIDVVTPGVTIDEKILDHRSNNFFSLCSFSSSESDRFVNARSQYWRVQCNGGRTVRDRKTSEEFLAKRDLAL